MPGLTRGPAWCNIGAMASRSDLEEREFRGGILDTVHGLRWARPLCLEAVP